MYLFNKISQILSWNRLDKHLPLVICMFSQSFFTLDDFSL